MKIRSRPRTSPCPVFNPLSLFTESEYQSMRRGGQVRSAAKYSPMHDAVLETVNIWFSSSSSSLSFVSVRVFVTDIDTKHRPWPISTGHRGIRRRTSRRCPVFVFPVASFVPPTTRTAVTTVRSGYRVTCVFVLVFHLRDRSTRVWNRSFASGGSRGSSRLNRTVSTTGPSTDWGPRGATRIFGDRPKTLADVGPND